MRRADSHNPDAGAAYSPGRPQAPRPGTPIKGPGTALEQRLHNKNQGLRWQMPPEAIVRAEWRSIAAHEQEITIQLSRTPDGGEDLLIHICCSHQPWLTKLKRNTNFTAEEVLTSEDGFILQVRGTLPAELLTLRTAKRGWCHDR